MKRLGFLLFSLILTLVVGCNLDDSVTETPPDTKSDIPVVINEIMASNDAAVTDENGEYDDWFELYNAGDTAVDIGGMYVSDDQTDLTMWQIPTTDPAKTTIPAKGFLVLWADGQPDQGVLHLDFKLSSGGEDIVLVESNGRVIIDQYTFGPQQTDVAIGRNPDGSDNWETMSTATPGASNSGAPSNVAPVIGDITVSPDSLTPTTPVIVSAKVTDEDGNLASVKITYSPEGQVTADTAMTAQGGDIYQADLGTFADGSRIFFFITAEDAEGLKAVSDTVSFEVGYIAPVLFINEFLASNDADTSDAFGEFDDWIEIYNPGPEAVNIGGMYISDDKTDLTAWQIPTTAPDSTTIPAGGFLLLWADKQPEQGILHVNIKLSSGGEDVVLTAPNGTTVIDSLTFGEQTTDVSMGRKPDGSDNWMFFDTPTPGASNN